MNLCVLTFLSLVITSHKRYQHRKFMSCCGSHAYDPSKHKCCSGHLHPTTDPGAECCGFALVTDLQKQKCCSSVENALVYMLQSHHSCCGHHYYDIRLWSCCAQHLIPEPQDNDLQGMRETDSSVEDRQDRHAVIVTGHYTMVLIDQTNFDLLCLFTSLYCNILLHITNKSLNACLMKVYGEFF